MYKLTFPWVNVFISSDCVKEEMKDSRALTELAIENTVRDFMGGLYSEEREYLDLFRRHGGHKVACLLAHGFDQDGIWYYEDGDFVRKVQSWITRHEEEYGVLLLACCNTGSLTPYSSRALLVLPDRTYSRALKSAAMVKIDLIHPTEGELGPILPYELQLLKEQSCQHA